MQNDDQDDLVDPAAAEDPDSNEPLDIDEKLQEVGMHPDGEEKIQPLDSEDQLQKEEP